MGECKLPVVSAKPRVRGALFYLDRLSDWKCASAIMLELRLRSRYEPRKLSITSIE